MHSSFSNDGKDEIKHLCKQAIEQGIKDIAITDHFEPRPNRKTHHDYNPTAILAEIIRLKSVLNNQLGIKMGIELGQPHQFKKETRHILNQVPYDYVLASIHYTRELGDIALACALKRDSSRLMEAYLDEMKQMIDFNYFNCVGHIDLPIRYCNMYNTPKIIIDDYQEQVKQLLSKVIDRGKGIEINTSGFRIKNLNRPLITKQMLALYKKLGGEILTIGSDAHCAKDVGKGIRQGIELAAEVGFKYITTFQDQKPTWQSIHGCQNVFQIKKVG